ncbi:sugar phosphate nucleotidyltransferase [Zeaxanthinibacter sp. PT1]|uniref:nucleotidyltransferase family protein n=1 Tax=Zeaxanthinibacter TaxID=561554 RepID=UPI0023496220|nr:sugar phosphate nucleotidyltransferase [Zeaxanthinibacter sp. PT1]MDC6350268.1 sugar phosphate nucleotidyltransferase [Zeaxanthinibacter sp. PT1]
MTLLLMAAGRGSRYGKLKQFDGFGPKEEFLMEFSIYDALENGFEHIVVITQKDNVNYLNEYLSSRLPSDIKLDVIPQELSDLPEGSSYSGERPKPWGTAHAVWSARNVIDNPFAVINADDYYGKQAFENAARFIRDGAGKDNYGLVAYTLSDTLSPFGTVSRGVCQTKGHMLESVQERTKLQQEGAVVKDHESGKEFTGEEMVSMNFWICHPSIFSHIESDFREFLKDEKNIQGSEVYLPFVIQEMLQAGEVSVEVIPSQSQWFGVTYSEDKESAVSLLQDMTATGGYRSPLWNMEQ